MSAAVRAGTTRASDFQKPESKVSADATPNVGPKHAPPNRRKVTAHAELSFRRAKADDTAARSADPFAAGAVCIEKSELGVANFQKRERE
jgi:hypothetical protein